MVGRTPRPETRVFYVNTGKRLSYRVKPDDVATEGKKAKEFEFCAVQSTKLKLNIGQGCPMFKLLPAFSEQAQQRQKDIYKIKVQFQCTDNCDLFEIIASVGIYRNIHQFLSIVCG